MSPEGLGRSPLTGALWENLVFTELAKWLSLFRPEWTIWFYRDQEQREADFLIQGPWNRLRILDAKWAETPPASAFASCEAVGEILERAGDITETEVGLISRGEANHRLGERRTRVSAFDVAGYLGG
jgi:hypothetical protein